MYIENLVIETTRKCNMTCGHCLRGDVENVDMDIKYIKALFKKVDSIGSITFTGGEPSLAVDVIGDILKVAEKNKVGIGSFYIATNAKRITKDFINVLLCFWLYCDDNEMSEVHWSNDDYHENSKEAIKLLSVLSFAKPKYSKEYPFTEKSISPEGRGANWGYYRKPPEAEGFEVDGEDIREGTLYLNCEGFLISGCDFSYETQRESEDVIIGKVQDFSIELIQQHNKKLNQQC